MTKEFSREKYQFLKVGFFRQIAILVLISQSKNFHELSDEST